MVIISLDWQASVSPAVKDSEKEEKSVWAPIWNKDQKQLRGKNQGGTINIHQVPIMLKEICVIFDQKLSCDNIFIEQEAEAQGKETTC